jgi:type 1 glutamine amidotransferase
VGGQFWRHKMDTIRHAFTQLNSPLTAGLPSFKAYDETYLHTHLQADNNVLAVRDIKGLIRHPGYGGCQPTSG